MSGEECERVDGLVDEQSYWLERSQVECKLGSPKRHLRHIPLFWVRSPIFISFLSAFFCIPLPGLPF